MYLSKLVLNNKSRRVAQELRSPYEMHRTLAKAFTFNEGSAEAKVLFRVEPGDNIYTVVLVQSHQEPDWNKITVTDDYFYSDNGSSVQVKQFEPVFKNQQKLNFRLRANPTRREAKSRKRRAISGEQNLIEWFNRKASQSGFAVIALEIRNEDITKTKIKDGSNQHLGQFKSVLFQGVLNVEDETVFAAAISNGIGSGKGIGFGLLSVGPVWD